ncbi:hypothetical protein N431DRAFT_242837 [Stipitochalara longipes BDJ]|nr:hypothetical protein N431DRAFT_242837 [Stipitochalara longipes BDJ]
MYVLDSSSMVRARQRMAAASDETLRPALPPLSYEYFAMSEHLQLGSFANPSSHHSHTILHLLPQALDVGPPDSSNSNTPDISQHFPQFSHKISPSPPCPGDQLTRRAALLPLSSTPYHRARSKAEPSELYTPLPLHLQANPAAIGSCAAAHIPGREACVSAGTLPPTAPREKHRDSCTLASPPVGSRRLSNIPSAIAWDGGNARAMGTTVVWGCSRFPLPVWYGDGRSCIALGKWARGLPLILLDGPDQ